MNPMFQIATNDKLSVLVQTRCGHTNMFQFLSMQGFAVDEHETLDEWINSPRRVVVLRHPIERMHSAIEVYDTQIKVLIDLYDSQADKAKFIEGLYQKNPQYTDYFVKNFFSVEDRNAVRDKLTFLVHSYPYLQHIADYDFEIIKFENFGSYIPPRHDPIYSRTVQSGVTHQTKRTYQDFPNNSFYTEQDLLKEVDLYNTIFESRKELTVREWQSIITQ